MLPHRIAPFLLPLICISPALSREKTDAPNRWEPAIRKFEADDAKNPPAKGGIVFVGSSSIRFWNLSKSFPNLDAVNRGFGGSYIADSVHFADRIVIKHRPKIVVLYAGDNDIAAGKPPRQVADDFRAFVKKIHTALPETRICFLAIKPSLARWKLWGAMRDANRRIADICGKNAKLVYVDVATPMLGADGTPRKDLFVPDGLHLSAKGYRIWTNVLRPNLVYREK